MNFNPRSATSSERDVAIPSGALRLEGTLGTPMSGQARGVIVFAHGSGSSRFSPRNRFVAGVLQQSGFLTLLTDLLSADEEQTDNLTHHLRFDIDMLAGRLTDIIDWTGEHGSLLPDKPGLKLGLFGASTGAAAALIAAARRPTRVAAVVSRGGRPDLAGRALAEVQAPTLLIVGGQDSIVIDLNKQAMAQMKTPTRLEIVAGATHLFEEHGALEQVATLAQRWFASYLRAPAGRH